MTGRLDIDGDDAEARRAIIRLLSLMSDGKEIRQYLQRFARLDQARFAVIKVGGAVLRDDLATLAEALAFLHTVGLTPVVVHGGGPQLDVALADAGVESRKIDGLRVTTPDVLAVARDVFTAENMRLVQAVRAAGARAAALPIGVFDAEPSADDRLGLVGEPTQARTDFLDSATRAGAIPILTSLGVTRSGQLVNMNADAAVRALVAALQPYKIVFLTDAGGVKDANGRTISAINLATDRETLLAADWLQGGMRVKIEEIARLLEVAPPTTSVSITRPEALAQELFTHIGAGTLVRRGERIDRVGEKDLIDRPRLEALVGAAFGRPVRTGWWEALDLEAAYVTQNYRAAAVVARKPGIAPGYLDKYAVSADAKGEGLGQAVWRRLCADWPQLVWRARTDNPINQFYFRECDGAVKRGDWTMFWRGLDDAEAASMADRVAAEPETLEPAA